MSDDQQAQADETENVAAANTQPQDKVSELEARVAELHTQKLQAMADFDNYRKRMEEKQSTFGAVANMGLIAELLQVFDDLQMALDDQELNLERAKESMQNAQDKLAAAASHAGVERLAIKSGDDFNPQIMEAITSVAVPDMTGKVVQVIGSGFKYTSKEGIVKPARVIVGKWIHRLLNKSKVSRKIFNTM